MSLNYPETIAALTPDQRLYFYELFAHQLTFSIRGILFTEGLLDAERIDRAKWLNEINHRITYNIFFLHKKNRQQWNESEIWEMIHQNIEKNPAIEEAVNTAIKHSHDLMMQYDSDVIIQSANNS